MDRRFLPRQHRTATLDNVKIRSPSINSLCINSFHESSLILIASYSLNLISIQEIIATRGGHDLTTGFNFFRAYQPLTEQRLVQIKQGQRPLAKSVFKVKQLQFKLTKLRAGFSIVYGLN